MKIMLCSLGVEGDGFLITNYFNVQKGLRRPGSSRRLRLSCGRRGVVLVVLVVLAVLSPGVLSPGAVMLQTTKSRV